MSLPVGTVSWLLMALFASSRERRLWLWTVAVVVAIYSTLGLAGTLAEKLPDAGVLDAALFLLGMLLVGVTVVIHGVSSRPAGAQIGIALGVATVYFMVFFRMTLAERSHLIEFGVVAVLIYEAFRERMARGRRVPMAPVLTVLLTGLVGTLDECIQLFLPNRVFDPVDIVFNILAAAMAVTASLALGWAKRRAGLSRSRSEET